MRYERLRDIVRLAVRLQGIRTGLTLDDIREELGVSRRTAERLREAVEGAFGPLESVDREDRRRYWRLQSNALRQLVRISPEELAELESAAAGLERGGLSERAGVLRELAVKLRAMGRPPEELDTDVELLMRAEGLAMRAGPRPRLEAGLLSVLREAIKTERVVEFGYLAQATGRRSRQRVQPYGVLYGNRAFLVGRTEWAGEARLWRLANMCDARIGDERFEHGPGFDLGRYARRSFGTFQERPVAVVLRFDADAAPDAAAFLFHPGQRIEQNADGSLTVRFTAGGIDEMCWHLFTWGESVTVEKPARLRRRLAAMCSALAAHHRD